MGLISRVSSRTYRRLLKREQKRIDWLTKMATQQKQTPVAEVSMGKEVIAETLMSQVDVGVSNLNLEAKMKIEVQQEVEIKIPLTATARYIDAAVVHDKK